MLSFSGGAEAVRSTPAVAGITKADLTALVFDEGAYNDSRE